MVVSLQFLVFRLRIKLKWMRLLRRFTPRNDKRENTLGINGLDCFTPFGRSQ